MMTDRKPIVTVLMPVYNGERYLRESIESILGQTFTDFECLIIDDGSIDASRDIIRSYCDPRIRLIENIDNLGLIKTLNCGLALAKGEYIARQDQDDISYPERLEKQVAFLNSHPEIAMLGTRINNIDEQGRKSTLYGYCIVCSELAIRWQLMFDNPFVHPSVMMRAKIVSDIGGYDERFPECEDYDLFSRLVYVHRAANLKEILFAYRQHLGSMNSNRTKENCLFIGRILRRTFTNYMNVGPDEEWIKLWLGINNLRNFSSNVDVKKLIQYIEAIYNKFISFYPMAQKDIEIKKHISHMLIRIAYNLAPKDRLASFYCFCRVFKRDIPLACAFLPKYLIALTLGPHRTFVAKKFRQYCDMKRKGQLALAR